MSAPGKPLQLLVVGGTGAVGQQVLRLALDDPRVGRVIAPTRRPLPALPRLENPVVDFTDLPLAATWWQVDGVICALGTTIKAAGSPEAFAAIDRDLPVLVASLARKAGATRCALNSSLGASPAGNLYLRTKAEAEAAIRRLGYPYYTIVRPSLIDAEREQSRPGEQMALVVARLCGPLIPRRYRPVTAEAIARALLEGVLQVAPGERIVESAELQD